MIITIYKCDLCKEETEAKKMYAAKSGLCMEIKAILKDRYRCDDTCTACFDTIMNGFNELVKSLIKVVD